MKFNARAIRSQQQRQAALEHDLKAAQEAERLHNHKGGGSMLPSTLGWGQHKVRKAKISLFDPFKGAAK